MSDSRSQKVKERMNKIKNEDLPQLTHCETLSKSIDDLIQAYASEKPGGSKIPEDPHECSFENECSEDLEEGVLGREGL